MGDGEARVDMAPDHLRIVRAIIARHVPHAPVWVFGSRARGGAKPWSDLDLAVITAEPLTLAVAAALAEDFSDSELPWRVDVVDWATTSDAFRRIIERDGVAL
jgi:type I restriction enzyme S subunit